MKNIIKFIFIGLCFSLPGEVVNQFYIHHSPQGFAITAAIYVIFLFLAYFLYKLFTKIVKNPAFNVILWYILFGIIGLWIEWNIIGNSPSQNPDANQLGMFTFWGAMVLMPLIFREGEYFNKLKKSIKRYWLIVSLLMVLPGIFQVNAGTYISIIAFTYGTIFLNYFILKYFYLKFKTSKQKSQQLAMPAP